ncbi:MAG: phasin family protein [Candidatus Competibacteraceae bacterium]|jgi:poly(hydroxyalkanoate) granule-associated protein|nr:phasin family protein [Candidatus Competibacteraceae bacterium]
MAKTPNNPVTELAGGLFEQIRLAGLGALATVQRESTRVLTALIEEGQSIEARFKNKSAMPPVKPQASAQDVAKLEQIFEDRVARILKQQKVPTKRDLQTLSAQMEVLQQTLDRLTKQRQHR